MRVILSRLRELCGVALALGALNLSVNAQRKLTITDLDLPVVVTEDVRPTEANSRRAGEAVPEIWRDRTLNRAVSREADFYRIDPLLIHAVIEQESGGRARARSHKGAVGVMQLMPRTGLRFGVRDRYSVDDNVRGGVGYLVWLLDFFQGDVALALAGYNAGEGAVLKYNRRVPPYRETQNYVLGIARRYKQLREQARAAEKSAR